MVNTRSILAGRLELLAIVVAVLSQDARAADISSNPFTPGGDSLSLTRTHPAFGAEAPADSLSYTVMANGSTTEDREATVTSDMQRLNTFFKTSMVTNYEQLTKYSKGAAKTAPWPSSYWPIYEDGINYAWNSQDKMPASEKYARAYGLDPVAFKQKVSQTSGILSQSSRTKCSTNNDCTRLKDSSACGKRTGETTGVCIPTWFGVCHAWAPAAIEEREPRCAVTKNGVTFQAFDIKALITQVYDGSSLSTVFTGSRFNGPDSPAKTDQDGRYTDVTRRDMGAGFFHIAIHNIMGVRQSSFVVDVDASAQVWNQPVRSYEVISATELTTAQAVQNFFPNEQSYVFNKAAAKLMFIQLKFNYVVEASVDGPLVSTGKVDSYTTTAYYEYVLELDSSGTIIGGEWVRNSRTTHPDFLWFPESTPTMDSVSDIGIKYKDIRELLDASADCKAIDSSASSGGATVAPSTAPASSVPVPAPSDDSSDTPTAAPAFPVTVTPVAPAGTPSPTPFSMGTITTGDSLTDWFKKWFEGRGGRWGRGN